MDLLSSLDFAYIYEKLLIPFSTQTRLDLLTVKEALNTSLNSMRFDKPSDNSSTESSLEETTKKYQLKTARKHTNIKRMLVTL